MEDMKLIEAYKTMSKASGIKKGDTVKVLREAGHHEMGWNDSWAMSVYCIGKEFEVGAVSNGKFMLGHYWYPFFVLEKVKDAPKPETVELMGKIYAQEAIEAALKNLQEID